MFSVVFSVRCGLTVANVWLQGTSDMWTRCESYWKSRSRRQPHTWQKKKIDEPSRSLGARLEIPLESEWGVNKHVSSSVIFGEGQQVSSERTGWWSPDSLIFSHGPKTHTQHLHLLTFSACHSGCRWVCWLSWLRPLQAVPTLPGKSCSASGCSAVKRLTRRLAR